MLRNFLIIFWKVLQAEFVRKSLKDMRKDTTKLILSNESLEQVPKDVFNFSLLRYLCLNNNALKSLPDDFKNLKNLKNLYVENNKLNSLPECICSLDCLTYLILNNNRIKKLPDNIGNLKGLFSLSLNNNRIKKLPDSIGDLKGLFSLNLNENEVVKLPDSIGNLQSLMLLGLHLNKLKTIPEGLLNLKSLIFLDIHLNRLETVPDGIGNWKILKMLNLSQNRLKKIPGSIGDLKKLTELDLSNNKLEKLPDGIGDLTKLDLLDLSNNKLESLPNTFKSIGYFNLSYNNLKSLPSCFRNMRKLVFLNLVENPNLVERGEGESLGKVELQAIFGDRVVFNGVEGPFEIVSKEKVLNDMRKKPIHWNIDVLSKIKSKGLETTNISEKKMLEIVENAKINGYISDKTRGSKNNYYNEYTDLCNYIKKLYNPDMEYSRWAMPKKYAEMTKNLLGSILEYFDEQLKVNKVESINFSLGSIAEGIRYCPDRQIAELKNAYFTINPAYINTLDDLIDYVVWSTKEKIFNLTVTPVMSSQNVHVQNYWKYELRNILGFDFEFKTAFGTMDQDQFHGHPGNALQAFFTKFNPNYMIELLKTKINEDSRLMCELMYRISVDKSLTKKQKMMILGSDDSYYSIPDKITEKAVEYILIKKRIFGMSNRTYWLNSIMLQILELPGRFLSIIFNIVRKGLKAIFSN